MAKSVDFSGKIGRRHFAVRKHHLALFIILSMMSGLVSIGCSSRKIEVGEIKYKKVVGIKNGEERILLTHNLGESPAMDPIYQDYFRNDSLDIEIGDRAEARILTDFEQVKYLAGLELCKNEDLEEFKLGRNHFNKLRIMPDLVIKVEYETRGNRVISLIDY